MKTIFLLAFLFLNTITFAQQHNDLKELGHKGKVKRLTMFNYDSAGVDQKTKSILDSKNWVHKTVEIFDKNGEYDTIYNTLRLNDEAGELFTVTTAYKNIGGFRYGYVQNAVSGNIDTQKYVWVNDSTYTIIERNLKTRSRIETFCFLDQEQREKGGKKRVFENDSLLYSWVYTNELSKDKLMMKNTVVNEQGGDSTVVKLEYFDKDGHGNPRRTVRTYSEGLNFCDVVTSVFEYWLVTTK